MGIRHSPVGSSSNPPLSSAGLQAWDSDHIGYDLLANDAPNQDFDLSGGGAVTIISKSIPTIVAKDAIWIEYWATILNNSGAGRTYTMGRNLGSFTTSITTGTLTNSATLRLMIHGEMRWSVSATNLSYLMVEDHITITPLASSTNSLTGVTGFPALAWNTNTGNNTGTQTAVLTWTSSAAVATQTLTLHSYKIWRAASAP